VGACMGYRVEAGRPGVRMGDVGGVGGRGGESLNMVAEWLPVSTFMVDRLVSGSTPSPCGLRWSDSRAFGGPQRDAAISLISRSHAAYPNTKPMRRGVRATEPAPGTYAFERPDW
jgi:hypothetical protein